MANEWFTPTDLGYIRYMETYWTGEFKGRTLETELGFDLDDYASNGWERPFFDDFDSGATIGTKPANITIEEEEKTGVEHWWAPARGPTGSGTVTAPGYTRPDFSTPPYKQMSESTVGLLAVRLPTITGFSGRFLSTTMQTQRRGATKIPPLNPGEWSYDDNLAFSIAWGYVEARMKLPSFPGAWPAFWAISDDEYYAPMFPRIEDDFVEMYNAEYASGISHHVPWLHKSNAAAIPAPGWTLLDKGWSANSAPGLNMVNFDGDGNVNDLSTGFHTFGRYMKKDPTAPNGIGWFIYYVDRREICRIPLITEWLRYYYLIVSLQTQDLGSSAGQSQMVNFEEHWLEVDYVGAWRDPSVEDPDRLEPYVAPTFDEPTKQVDLSRLEAHLSMKWQIPLNGSVADPEHSNTDTPPVMAPTARFVLVEGTDSGSVGTVAVTNTPTNPVKYRLEGENADDFTFDEETGEITVATELEVGTYDLAVSAWDSPLTPVVQGTNCTRVIIDVREDATFDLSYWARGAVPKLRAWIDAQDSDSFDVENTNEIAKIRDKSPYKLEWRQSDAAKRPLLNATGVGGAPSFESQNSAVRMTGTQIISTSAISNIVTRSNGALSMGNGAVTANSVYTAGNPVVFVQWWKADPAANPDTVTSIVNGTLVSNASASPTNKSFTILACAVFVPDSAGGQNLGRIMNGADLFTDGAGSPGWFDGKLGEVGVVYWPGNEGPTADEVDKLVGGLHWKWGLEDLLPAEHPYKSAAPRLWE